MSLFRKPLDEINAADIRGLWEREVAESETCDFKLGSVALEAVSPGVAKEARDKSLEDLISDIAAFANASGGDLIIGVDESEEGVAKEPKTTKFRKFLTADEIEGLVTDLCRQRLAPAHLFPVIARIIPVQHSDGVEFPLAVIRIQSGSAAPHAVMRGRGFHFKKRGNRHTQDMDIHAVRDAFLASEEKSERLARFREERMRPHVINQFRSAFLLHIQPLAALNSRMNISPSVAQSAFDENRFVGVLEMLGKAFLNHRHITSSGLSMAGTHTDFKFPKNMEEFITILRNGNIEWCFKGALHHPSFDSTATCIPWDRIEMHWSSELKRLPRVLEMMGVAGPVCVTISGNHLSGIHCVHLCEGSLGAQQSSHQFVDQTIRTVEHLVGDPASVSDWGKELEPVFEQVWNAAGLLKRPVLPL